MKAQASETASEIVKWLQTTGLEYGCRILAAVVILAVGAVVIRLASKALAKMLEKTRLGEKSLVAKFLVSVAVKVAWAFLLVIVLGKLGVDVGPIIAGLGVTGFILGFAFQESLGSLAAGLMIAVNKPFKVGDFVSVAGLDGSITALDMMAVTMATGDNKKITIPNKQVWGAPIVNYSALARRRVDFAVGVSYGTDISLAKKTAIAAVSSVKGVLADPAPMAEVKSLDDSSVALTVRAWANNADYWSVYFAGIQSIKESFDRAGVTIPFPQMDVHVTQA